MKKRLLTAAGALLLVCGGCLGPNKAFNAVHEWNQEVSEERWVNEVVHIVLWVVPVYQLSLWADLLVFNSIEWWGGENPIGD